MYIIGVKKMVAKKFITISKNEEEVDGPQTLRVTKLYKLLDIITECVSDSSYKIPMFYNDLDQNNQLCGLNEIDMSLLQNISSGLSVFHSQYLSVFEEFSKKVFEIEQNAIDFLKEISDQNALNAKESEDVFKPISFNFVNQDGQADIKIKISLPIKPYENSINVDSAEFNPIPQVVDHNAENAENAEVALKNDNNDHVHNV